MDDILALRRSRLGFTAREAARMREQVDAQPTLRLQAPSRIVAGTVVDGDVDTRTLLAALEMLPRRPERIVVQSVYPFDWRAVSVAHVGGDIYGTIRTGRGGSLSYTGFAGSIPHDPRGGFRYGIEAQGGRLTSDVMGRMTGVDLRWDSPIAGLMIRGDRRHHSSTGRRCVGGYARGSRLGLIACWPS
jgi:hypothetical protein